MPNTQIALNSKKSSVKNSPHPHTDLESMTDQIRDRYEALISNTAETGKTSLSFIKKYPFYTVTGVVAIGAAATLYLKSRRSLT